MARIFVIPLVFLLFWTFPVSAVDAQPPEIPAPGEASKDAPAPEDWAGLWYTSFGFVDLAVDGNAVTGTYSCCNGVLEGTVEGTQIEFSWKDPIYGEGWGYWYWQDEGLRMRGVFGKMEDRGTGGQWTAVRPPEPRLGEDAVRFAVRAEHPRHGTFRGEARLSGLEGDSIEGTLRGAYDLEARGGAFKYDMWNLLDGRREGDALVLEWVDPLYKTLGDLRLELTESGDWAGTWQPHFTEPEEERPEIRFLSPE